MRPKPLRVLTVDLEDWFHLLAHPESDDPARWGGMPSRIEATTERLLELFDGAGVKGTFFALGWVARRHPALLRSIAGQGHELGCHSDVHALVDRMTPDAFRNDLRRSCASIEDAAGVKVRSYRAPGFSITANSTWAFGVLAAEGIEHDCSVFPGAHAHGGLRGISPAGPLRIVTEHGEIHEFPVTTWRLFGRDLAVAGGGYFRLLPARVVKELAGRASYLMTYFHPRDFDPGQPVVPGLSMMRRFRAYVGLKKAAPKLEALLRLGGFGPVGEIADRIDWSERPTIPLASLGSKRWRDPGGCASANVP
jgi:polysaccharide deacetylase family protein (PEP-CTERM system associated)